jgi:hypothetical protein
LFHLLERPFFGAVARRDCARNALFLALERPFLARSNGSTAEDLRVFDHKFRVNFATPVRSAVGRFGFGAVVFGAVH